MHNTNNNIKILSEIYNRQINECNTNENMSWVDTTNNLTEVNQRLSDMQKNKILDKNNLITSAGRKSIKVVMTGGVFDIIHPGHIHMLDLMNQLGDTLVVVVAHDNTAIKMKKHAPLHNQKTRMRLVNSLKSVGACLAGNDGDIFQIVKKIKPDIIALGYDQLHQKKHIQDGCNKIGIDADVRRIESFFPETSSSKIQKIYGEKLYQV